MSYFAAIYYSGSLSSIYARDQRLGQEGSGSKTSLHANVHLHGVGHDAP
jgi:hypothetical protein